MTLLMCDYSHSIVPGGTETDIDTFINESDRRRFEWCENYSHSIVT
jgi:hypothetical protein